MTDMLANRYLLNGELTAALERYRAALAADPDQPAMQCRLILAQLELSRIDDAAGFVLGVLFEDGAAGLARLRAGCRGFVPSDVPGDHDVLIGLRALLEGDSDRALSRLHKVPADEFPAVAALVRHLEDAHAG